MEMGLSLGATRVDQLEDNLEFCKKGPLDEGVVRAVDELWKAVGESTDKTAFV
jgi:aflatoxin B1 aldehyde reductase